MRNKQKIVFEPGRLWSLWEMIEILMSELLDDHAFFSGANSSMPFGNQVAFKDKQQLQNFLGRAERFEQALRTVGLPVGAKIARRLINAVKSATFVAGSGYVVSEIESAQAKSALFGLTENLGHEAETHKFFKLSPELVWLYDQTDPPFRDVNMSKFGGAEAEVSEAAKCIALKRNKAAVFHLMLAMEEAVRLLAKKGATTHDSQGRWLTWQVLANNIDSQIITAMPNGPGKVAWQNASSMLKSVGHAWRNPTDHPGASFSEEETMDVFYAVKGFMRALTDLL